MAAPTKLTGIYEGPNVPNLSRGDTIELVGFEHDRNGKAVVWVLANERILCVFAEYVRVAK